MHKNFQLYLLSSITTSLLSFSSRSLFLSARTLFSFLLSSSCLFAYHNNSPSYLIPSFPSSALFTFISSARSLVPICSLSVLPPFVLPPGVFLHWSSVISFISVSGLFWGPSGVSFRPGWLFTPLVLLRPTPFVSRKLGANVLSVGLLVSLPSTIASWTVLIPAVFTVLVAAVWTRRTSALRSAWVVTRN